MRTSFGAAGSRAMGWASTRSVDGASPGVSGARDAGPAQADIKTTTLAVVAARRERSRLIVQIVYVHAAM
jgi:hypothetical protein